MIKQVHNLRDWISKNSKLKKKNNQKMYKNKAMN